MNKAFVITPSQITEHTPTFKKGCEKTKGFAARSSLAHCLGGVTLSFPHDVKEESIREAIAILNSYKTV